MGLSDRDLGLRGADLGLADPEREPLRDRDLDALVFGVPEAFDLAEASDLWLWGDAERLERAGELDLLWEVFEALDEFRERADAADFGEPLAERAGLWDADLEITNKHALSNLLSLSYF